MKLLPGLQRCNAAALAVLCLLTTVRAEDAAPPAPPLRSTVFFVSDNAALAPGRRVNPTVVRRMVDRIITAATGKPTPGAAWGSLVKKSDRVGIKVAASGGSVSGTNPEVVDAIVDGLLAAGLTPAQIIVWDRNLQDLLAAGFRRDGSRYQLRWIDPRTGYDKKSQLTAPVLGRLIWGDSGFGDKDGNRFSDLLSGGEQLSSRSYYATVLTKEVTKIINVPSLTDSFLTGVHGALANVTFGNIDNWRRFTKPPAFGDPYLAEIYSDAVIRDKVVFTLLDALVLQYAGGPFANPGFLVDHFTIYGGFDPVAIDATAMRLLDESRQPSKLPSLGPLTGWLQSAESLGLGNAAAEKIDLVRAEP